MVDMCRVDEGSRLGRTNQRRYGRQFVEELTKAVGPVGY